MRITVQLIDVGNDNHLWAENYDRPLSVSNLFDIQTDVTEQIARALETELTIEELDELRQLPTDSLDIDHRRRSPHWLSTIFGQAITTMR